eukprot:gene6472-9716_t
MTNTAQARCKRHAAMTAKQRSRDLKGKPPCTPCGAARRRAAAARTAARPAITKPRRAAAARARRAAARGGQPRTDCAIRPAVDDDTDVIVDVLRSAFGADGGDISAPRVRNLLRQVLSVVALRRRRIHC